MASDKISDLDNINNEIDINEMVNILKPYIYP